MNNQSHLDLSKERHVVYMNNQFYLHLQVKHGVQDCSLALYAAWD
jgi:hypothetical protein